MELKLEEFVRDIKEYNAEKVICEFDFVYDGERYKARISVKKFGEELESRNRQAEGFCAVDEMIEEKEQEDDDTKGVDNKCRY